MGLKLEMSYLLITVSPCLTVFLSRVGERGTGVQAGGYRRAGLCLLPVPRKHGPKGVGRGRLCVFEPRALTLP